jgi:hypothetical protein
MALLTSPPLTAADYAEPQSVLTVRSVTGGLAPAAL